MIGVLPGQKDAQARYRQQVADEDAEYSDASEHQDWEVSDGDGDDDVEDLYYDSEGEDNSIDQAGLTPKKATTTEVNQVGGRRHRRHRRSRAHKSRKTRKSRKKQANIQNHAANVRTETVIPLVSRKLTKVKRDGYTIKTLKEVRRLIKPGKHIESVKVVQVTA